MGEGKDRGPKGKGQGQRKEEREGEEEGRGQGRKGKERDQRSRSTKNKKKKKSLVDFLVGLFFFRRFFFDGSDLSLKFGRVGSILEVFFVWDFLSN